MIVNLTKNYQFSTRLCLENKMLEQVQETGLFGVVMNDKLTWHSNTEFMIKKAYKRSGNFLDSDFRNCHKHYLFINFCIQNRIIGLNLSFNISKLFIKGP